MTEHCLSYFTSSGPCLWDPTKSCRVLGTGKLICMGMPTVHGRCILLYRC